MAIPPFGEIYPDSRNESIAKRVVRGHSALVTSKEELAPPAAEDGWTRPEPYFEALARRRTARRKREPEARARTQPESPRLLLSTLPFIALIAALGLLTVAIMVAAWPGRPERHPPRQQHEQGVAPKGWYQKAQREFR